MNFKLIKDALESGIENTQALAIDHLVTLGRTTKKNNETAIQYEQDIAQMQEAIAELSKHQQ